jgi:hypothetical protein
MENDAIRRVRLAPFIVDQALGDVAGVGAVGRAVAVGPAVDVREEDIEPAVEPSARPRAGGPPALAHGVPERRVDLAGPGSGELVQEREQAVAPLPRELRLAAGQQPSRRLPQQLPVGLRALQQWERTSFSCGPLFYTRGFDAERNGLLENRSR